MKNAGKYLIAYVIMCVVVFMLINQKVNTQSDIILTVELMLEKPDELTIYHGKRDSHLTETETVRKKIVGKNKMQTLQFILPAASNKLRFDLGRNKNQGLIKIANIELNRRGQTKVLDPSIISNYFKPNEYIDKVEIVDNLLAISTKAVKGNYDPYFNEVTIDHLYK